MNKYKEKSYAKPVRAVSFLLSILLMFSMLFVGSVDTLTASAAAVSGPAKLYFDFTPTRSDSWWMNDGILPGIWWWGEGVASKFNYLINAGDPDNPYVYYLDIPEGQNCTNFVLLRMKDSSVPNGSTDWGKNLTGHYYSQYPASDGLSVSSYGNCFRFEACSNQPYIERWTTYTPSVAPDPDIPTSPGSLSGHVLYFKDLTGYADSLDGSVEAVFTSSELDKTAAVSTFETASEPMPMALEPGASQDIELVKLPMERADVNEPGLFFVTIPSDYYYKDEDAGESEEKAYAYDEIKFIVYDDLYAAEENKVSYETKTWKILNEGEAGENQFVYKTDSCDTYYFGPTETFHNSTLEDYKNEYSDSNDYSYWNKRVYPEPMEGKQLYFDTNILPNNEGVDYYIEIGYKSEIKDFQDKSYSADTPYTFGEDILQSDVITVSKHEGMKYHFLWINAVDYNKVAVTNNVAVVDKVYTASVHKTVYFDATLSKLSYESECYYGAKSMPNSGYNDVKIYTYGASSSKMTKYNSAQWKDLYYMTDVDISKKIRFASYESASSASTNGDGTELLTVPPGLVNPCFYADSGDDVSYTGGARGGYWDEAFKVRDPEVEAQQNGNGDVVNIGSSKFERTAETLYVDTTFYDYYSDYELNGKNRDDYPNISQGYRLWYPYRQFNQALSDYYSAVSVSDPLYEGHFQPSVADWGYKFADLKASLNLYGFSSATSNSNYKRFFTNNNSVLDINGTVTDGEYDRVVRNLASSKLKNGDIYTYDNKAIMPYFNENFLTGTNSKNTKLAKVYKDVLFPFEKKDIKDNGVDYWYFNADNTTLAMKQDIDTGSYFLENEGSKKSWAENKEASTTGKGTYGFFPFNDSKSNSTAKYNYGYGMKMEFTFRLTDDGKVTGVKNGKETTVPIQFNFSGDDDVWVYIDDNLILDVGGEHGKVSGVIDFAEQTATVGNVKKSANNTNTSKSVSFKDIALNGDGDKEGSALYSNTAEHTLVMYYMERGMWESNLEVSFNFPDSNELEVEKRVDYSNVDSDFQDCFKNNSNFEFEIQNMVTHYGDKDPDSTNADPSQIDHFAVNFAKDGASTVKAATDAVNAEVVNDYEGEKNVMKWSSENDIREHSTTDLRYINSRLATFTSDDGEAADIAGLEYMRFHIRMPSVDSEDDNNIDLNKIYIRLTDTEGHILHGYLSGSRILGTPELLTGQWCQIRVLLDKLAEYNGSFNGKVQSISFQYDDAAEIYLNDFIFQPTTKLAATVGFERAQSDIADYKSAESGKLENILGAVYVADNATPNNDSDDVIRTVGEESRVYLKNNETVRFTDQFRRGSYLYIEEKLTSAQKKLFSTTWTMYENNKVVSGFNMAEQSYTTNNNPNLNMQRVSSTYVYDDRTEKILKANDKQSDGDFDNDIIHNAYTISNLEAHMASHTGDRYTVEPVYNTEANQPEYEYHGGDNTDTIVFRSYASPDELASNPIKLKVLYENKANVGILKITKAQAEDSQNLDETKYTFYVEFSNVGGIGLEENNIIKGPYELKAGESVELEGIPVGTEYRIHEVVPKDGSSLQSVYKTGSGVINNNPTIGGDTLIVDGERYETRYVDGTIVDSARYENTFYNYKFSVSINIKKNWKKDPTDSTEIIYPKQIYVQLQRINTNDNTDPETWDEAKWEAVEGYEVVKIDRPAADESGVVSKEWLNNAITGLPMYEDNNSKKGLYAYRIVEYELTFDPNNAETKELIWTTKEVDDPDNPPDGKKTIDVYNTEELEKFLVADGTIENKSGQHFTVTYGDPKYGNGSSVEEAPLEVSVTNTLVKEPDKIDYTVTKNWFDGAPSGDGDGTTIILTLQQSTDETAEKTDDDESAKWKNLKRVAIKIADKKVQYYKYDVTGEEPDLNSSDIKWTDLDADNIITGAGNSVSWKYAFTDLPETTSDSTEIKYRVIETEVPTGYYKVEKHEESASTITNYKLVENLPEAGRAKVISATLIGGFAVILSVIAFYLYKKKKILN